MSTATTWLQTPWTTGPAGRGWTLSDLANCPRAGPPARRLVAGCDSPAAHSRVVLPPAATRDKVGRGELRSAPLFTAALVAAACNADPAEVAKWRSG